MQYSFYFTCTSLSSVFILTKTFLKFPEPSGNLISADKNKYLSYIIEASFGRENNKKKKLSFDRLHLTPNYELFNCSFSPPNTFYHA